MSVLIETSLGDIVIDLHYEICPKTCENFLTLCQMKYYNGIPFSRIETDFVTEIGDCVQQNYLTNTSAYGALTKTSHYFDDEINEILTHKKKGAVSMSHIDNNPNTNAARFFITLHDGLNELDEKFTVFAQVTEGSEILTQLNEISRTKELSHIQIRIRHTTVLFDPFNTHEKILRFMSSIPESPKTSYHELDYESLNKKESLNSADLNEKLKESETRARAVLLEMLGDLPSADYTPDERTLFVCKLNRITNSDDLRLIFSRFGQIENCDVIYDKITKQSLSYAFIRFTTRRSCEEAYIKMNNVLIDDRRIKVDFSQSTALIKKQMESRSHQTDDISDAIRIASEISKNIQNQLHYNQQSQTSHQLYDENDERQEYQSETNNKDYDNSRGHHYKLHSSQHQRCSYREVDNSRKSSNARHRSRSRNHHKSHSSRRSSRHSSHRKHHKSPSSDVSSLDCRHSNCSGDENSNNRKHYHECEFDRSDRYYRSRSRQLQSASHGHYL